MPPARKARKKKVIRRRVKGANKYRSGLEDDIGNYLTKQSVKYNYEKEKINYIVPSSSHIYTPDFTFTAKDGHTIYVEAKGIFTYEDRYKHLLIRQQHGDKYDIRFVFSRSKSRISKGSKTTYADICNGLGRGAWRGVCWKYADKQVPDSWLTE